MWLQVLFALPSGMSTAAMAIRAALPAAPMRHQCTLGRLNQPTPHAHTHTRTHSPTHKLPHPPVQDADFEAALDAADAADAAGVEGVVAELAELASIPAVEYSAAMFPEDADLELFESLLDATQNYMGGLWFRVEGVVTRGGPVTVFWRPMQGHGVPEQLIERGSEAGACGAALLRPCGPLQHNSSCVSTWRCA